MFRIAASLALPILAAVAPPSAAQEVEPLGTDLERFAYPWPVEYMHVRLGGADARMAYMDVKPARPNGRAIVLLHGKNFCGATWESTARALSAAGYRVLIPDQFGFCKSSKPANAQYSFAMMAEMTHRLIGKVGMERPVVLGHSTGGMLGLRYALMYPHSLSRLVLVNPLGLVDRMAEGVPYVPLEALIMAEQDKDRAAMKQYQLGTYYHGEWRSEYDKWVDMLAGQYATEDDDAVEIAQAKTAEMILTQPVSHEFERLATPVTLIIGMKDTTVFGKGQASDELKAKLRPIPQVVDEAAARMPDAHIVRFPELGHSPQVEAPERFERMLLEVLAAKR